MVVLNRGKQQTVIWIVAFTDEQGASLFADFYRKVLDNADAAQSGGDEDSGPIAHDLQAMGNKVLVIAGPGASQFQALAPAVWQASQVSDLNPPPPSAVDSDDDQGNSVTRAVEYIRGFIGDWLGYGKSPDPLKYN